MSFKDDNKTAGPFWRVTPHINEDQGTKTHHNPPKPAETNQNQPKPAKTN